VIERRRSFANRFFPENAPPSMTARPNTQRLAQRSLGGPFMPSIPVTVPTIAVGWGFSAMVHLGAIALVALWPRGVVDRPEEAHGPIAVTTILPATETQAASSSTAQEPARQGLGLATRRTRGHSPRPQSRPRRKPPDTFALTPMAQRSENRPLSASSSAPVKQPSLPPIRPIRIDAEMAKELRIYDVFPNRPDSWRVAGSTPPVLLEVCVSEHGSVTDVKVAEAGSSPLASLLVASIRTWRYRTLAVNGVATAFCHDVRIRYRTY
jgi:hypothetical protein